MDVYATVDGRLVRASSLVQTRMFESFPSGASMRVRGFALALPVAPNHYVYGVFRSIDGNVLEDWVFIPTALTGFVFGEDQRLKRPPVAQSSSSNFQDYVVDRMKGRVLTICRPKGEGFPTQSRCPVFMYFERPSDPLSVKMIVPGEKAEVAGYQVMLDRVTLTFQEAGETSGSDESHLPTFLKGNRDTTLGRLPDHLLTVGARQLYKRDFRRDQ